MHRHGDVVGEDRDVESLAEDAEVPLDLRRVGAGVEGRSHHHTVAPDRRRRRGVLGDAQRRHVDGPGEDRQLTGESAAHDLEHRAAMGIGQVGDLARRAEHEQPVDAAGDEEVDEAFERRHVDVESARERRADGRDHAAEARLLNVHQDCPTS